MTASPGHVEVSLVESAEDLQRVVEECSRAEAIAVDVEADGLHAYRPKLCTVQLAWDDRVAVIDALAVDVTQLSHVLGQDGPIKILHDLTFDARLLAETGAPIARVRDTSVVARFLGFRATGLATLVQSELGQTLDKRFQHHDWSARPLLTPHLDYLAGDVRHLVALEARLAILATEKDILDEVAEECSYKLATATRPPRDARPAYVRVKGAQLLDTVGRAVLRHLVSEREQIAETLNIPSFKVMGGDPLLELARRRPTSHAALRSVRGAGSGHAGRHPLAWLRAIEQGMRDGDIPAEDRVYFERPRIDRVLVAARRGRENQVSAWRREEAARRGVDEQAVLPGHCAQALVDVLVAPAGSTDVAAAIAAIPGLGASRVARYGEAFVKLGATPLPSHAAGATSEIASEALPPSGEPLG
jgi:ribonuclease D